MGRVSFASQDIPVMGPPREVLNERMEVDGESLICCAATLGNPHCVILGEQVSPELAQRLGPLIECAPQFPKHTNVQFMQVLDGENIRIEIWERGAGYTLASGSSSCAAAAVAHRLGWCGQDITVHMPGGQLSVSLSPDWFATLSGPVQRVFDGILNLESG
jgi:diaminopimelate epimerase